MIYLNLLDFGSTTATRANIAATSSSINNSEYLNTTQLAGITKTTIETTNNIQKHIVCVSIRSCLEIIYYTT